MQDLLCNSGPPQEAQNLTANNIAVEPRGGWVVGVGSLTIRDSAHHAFFIRDVDNLRF